MLGEAQVVERGVLGAMLVSDGAVAEVVTLLGEGEAFENKSARATYRAMADLWRRNEPVDVVEVCHALLRSGELDAVGGETAVTALVDYAGSAAHAVEHARRVLDAHRRWAAVETLDGLRDDLWRAETAADGVLAAATALRKIAGSDDTGTVSVGDAVDRALWGVGGGEASLVATGLPALDALLGGGIPLGETTVVAAHTSRGKSAFAQAVALTTARAGGRVLWVSLEMTAAQIGERLLAAESRISVPVARRLSRNDAALWQRERQAATTLRALPIVVCESSRLTAEGVRALAERAHAQGALRLVVVDYVGLLAEPKGSRSRNEALGDISRDLKALAKDLGCAVLVLSQLNRESARENREPDLHDLRDSGSLEQDPAVVLFLHRSDWSDPPPEVVPVKILLRKNRHGEIGSVEVGFRRALTQFEARP